MTVWTSGPADRFAEIVDVLIRRDGGPGNRAQLRYQLRPGQPCNQEQIFARWQVIRDACPILSARWRGGLRGPRWQITSSQARSSDLPALHLGVTPETVVLSWDHRLCDVRAALSLGQALADQAPLTDLATADHGQRWPAELPRQAALRGRQARQLPRLIADLRGGHWQPRRLPGVGILPLQRGQAIASGERQTTIQAQQRRASGRFGESAYGLACLAATLYRVAGARGRLLFPLAVDIRGSQQRHALINGHGFLFCSVAAERAAADRTAAAQAIQAAQKQWLEAAGVNNLLAGLSFTKYLPLPLLRRELGFRGPGLGASAICGFSGVNALPSTLGGVPCYGVDHGVVPTAAPGLAVLIHRDLRGLVIDVIASAAVAVHCPPQLLADALLATMEQG